VFIDIVYVYKKAMKSDLSMLLKKVFFTSLAGIMAKEVNGGAAVDISSYHNVDENTTLTIEKVSNLQPKLLLKQNSNEEWSVLAHRSHRSHSSHRSHYSSSTSGTNRSSGSGSSGSSSGAGSGASGGTGWPAPIVSPAKSRQTNSGISATALKLGSRTLKRGMSGTDVTELVNILLKKKYLKLENDETQVTGSLIYDETIEATVEQFQKDNKLTVDGVCGPLTVFYLKKDE
jgi:hypothetical protein